MLKAVFLLACLVSLPAHADSCVRFGAMITLTGRYEPHVLAAQPAGDYDHRRDQGRTSNLLYLVPPLCIDGDVLSEGVPAATDVQVLCPDLAAGSKVTVTGRLF